QDPCRTDRRLHKESLHGTRAASEHETQATRNRAGPRICEIIDARTAVPVPENTSGSRPEYPVKSTRLSAETYSRALRAERVSSGRSRSYDTVMFWRRAKVPLSIQRDEKIAGSWIPVGSVTASRRKFLSCSAFPCVA